MLYFGPTPRGSEARHPFALASKQTGFGRLRAASAFVTESGVDQIRTLVEPDVFEAVEKEWLIGLENGFTQPEALRRLLRLPNSRVCLVHVHDVLESPSLTAPTFFHPKLYEFAALDRLEATIVATSANLTEGGLRGNIEQFLSWRGDLNEEIATTLDAWWRKIWKPEWLATDELIETYNRRRPIIQQYSRGRPPGRIEPTIEIEPAASELRSARLMWIEAIRPLEGGARNQLELMLNAYTFFFPELEDVPRDTPRSLTFVDDTGREFANPNRQILFNGPPLRARGNSMWRVYLPTAHEGLSGYQQGGLLIRFLRTSSRDRYHLSFAPTESAEADEWYERSSKVASISRPPMRRMGWNL